MYRRCLHVAKGNAVNTTAKKKRSGKRASLRTFLEKKGITLSPKVYFVDAMGAMALGLFATLLMGTIFGTVAAYLPEGAVKDLFQNMTTYAKSATGAVLGVAIAYSLKAAPLIIFSAGAVGLCANSLEFAFEGLATKVSAGPAGAFVCVLLAVEIGKLVSKATKIDIIITPLVTILSGVGISMLVCPVISYVMYWTGLFINTATEMLPFLMGIVIATVVGMILTLPVSSAAICAMIGISGLAGGAAVVGCCAQMVGFAVISFRENKWGGVLAQGVGTSMLQMGNITKKPVIWLPVILSSMICGPVATCVFKLECTGVSAGMGTCGLVGPIGVFTDMGFGVNSILGVLVTCIIMPAGLSLLFSEIMRRFKWIKHGDMKLNL